MFRFDEGLEGLPAPGSRGFRKSINGLSALVGEQSLGLDPFARAVYVFRNRRADRIKLFNGGPERILALLKRLEADRFAWPRWGGSGDALGRATSLAAGRHRHQCRPAASTAILPTGRVNAA
ncbi:IS66 family insertion sequence element accessory protein TnpB [Cupriavidus basilensis]